MTSESQAAAEYWSGRGRRLARQLNLAVWLEIWLPLAACAAAASAVTLLIARRAAGVSAMVFGALALPWLASLAWSTWRARGARFTALEGLTRLDSALGLRGRLVSADAGIGPWPVPKGRGAGFAWRFGRILPVLGFVAALLAVGAWVPLPGRRDVSTSAVPPRNWAEMQAWVDGLRERELVEPEDLRAFQQGLTALREHPPEDWYRHESLEAGDALSEKLRQSLRSLADGLDSSEQALERAASRAAGADDAADRKALAGSIGALGRGHLRADQRLQERLNAAARLRTLNPGEMASLRQRLSEGARFCRLASRECAPGDPDCLRRAGSGASGRAERGPGPAPLTVRDERTDLATRALEGVSGRDLARATLGDVLGEQSGAHAVDEGAFQRTRAGQLSAHGSGGEAVWKDQLTPDERKVLESYFK